LYGVPHLWLPVTCSYSFRVAVMHEEGEPRRNKRKRNLEKKAEVQKQNQEDQVHKSEMSIAVSNPMLMYDLMGGYFVRNSSDRRTIRRCRYKHPVVACHPPIIRDVESSPRKHIGRKARKSSLLPAFYLTRFHRM
jgi:hypothetical protein